MAWVTSYFDPYKRECVECMNYDAGTCQVVEHIEYLWRCPELVEFVRYEDIRTSPAIRRYIKNL